MSLLKKHKRLGHTGIVGNSVDLSIPDFFKVSKKGMERSNKQYIIQMQNSQYQRHIAAGRWCPYHGPTNFS